jgi:hypothetical protein
VQLIIPQKVKQTRTMNCSGGGMAQPGLTLSSDMCTAWQLLRKILKDFMAGESQVQIEILSSAERVSEPYN